MIRAEFPCVPFRFGLSPGLLVIVAFGWLLSMAGVAEAMEFTKIVDELTPLPGQPRSSNTLIPGGTGHFGGPFGAVGLTPSFGLSGSTFAFARNIGGVYGVSTGGAR